MGESYLLPNGALYERDHDGEGYRRIAAWFGARGFDLEVDETKIAAAWPIATEKTSLLDRLGTPIFLGSMGYYHTAFDVLRAPEDTGTQVVAPHAGLAMVFDWTGNPTNPRENPYSSVVAIYDPVSHVVTQLMHCKATEKLGAATEPVEVKEGDVICEIANSPFQGEAADRLRHTHVGFIDGDRKLILNPARLFRDYHDSVAPGVRRVYVADERAVTSDRLVSGKIDVVIEAFDRDDDSNRNFEVSAVSYEIEDGSGRTLAELARCELDHVYESVAGPSSFRAKQLIDFGSARSQLGGGWPSSDIDNPDRTFRYALTQLALVDGRCTVLDDTEGHLEIATNVESITVRTVLWDPKGNKAEHTTTLTRGVSADGGPPRDGGTSADGGH